MGAAALSTLENVQKSTIVGQKIGLKSGEIFVNIRFFIVPPPLIFITPMPMLNNLGIVYFGMCS